jgi:hypothetical protein
MQVMDLDSLLIPTNKMSKRLFIGQTRVFEYWQILGDIKVLFRVILEVYPFELQIRIFMD